MDRETIMEVCRDSALGAGFEADDPRVRAMSNNIAAVLLAEYEWQRDVRAHFADVADVGRDVLEDTKSEHDRPATALARVSVGRLMQMALALSKVDHLLEIEREHTPEPAEAVGS